ncbi:hypothetical protein [Parasphingorhabdus halotolerans]|uniref:Secreted protein n=1 Tax=Parasphingorhabdus halotolerans TaxID=2725558 RepID=A0A6H2DML3_9SPHN|nr:hypothetical protein [Parasphingorhabdus halotolerans]QJB69195.1 hypothetical protein HF685_07820 [Parasphingorhabdus halotolerans]
MSSKIATATASLALVFTGFTPAMAAPMNPNIATATPFEVGALGWSADVEKAEGWRSNRGYRGYRGYGHRRHRDRIDGGDVLAGILIIGGIAAIASAASKNKTDRRYEDRDTRDRDYRSDNQRYDDRRSDSRSADRGAGSVDQAINVCSNAAEQRAGSDARVSEIRSVTKDGNGWRVEGDLSNSEERTFLCGSTEGRVDFVQLGSGDLAFAN